MSVDRRIARAAVAIAIGATALVVARPVQGWTIPCEDRTSGYVDAWENSNYRGGHIRFCGNDSDFTNNRFDNGLGVNDNISSWKFRPGYVTTFKFYRNTGYSGDWGWIDDSSAQSATDRNYISIYRNDAFSSIRFNP